MKTWVLKIRNTDAMIFQMIKYGEKTVETRAATKEINPGDKVVFICGKKRLEKTVGEVRRYSDFEEYLEKEDLKQVFGASITKEKAREIHYSFPGYEKKLKRYGINAFDLND